MTRAGGSAGFSPRVSRDAAHEAVRQGLLAHLWPCGTWTVKRLGNETGVPDRLIECAKVEVGSPEWRALPFERVLSIAAVLGPTFTNEWLSLVHQGSFEMLTAIEQTPGEATAALACELAEFTVYAADNRISVDERPKVLALSSRLKRHARALAALGRSP